MFKMNNQITFFFLLLLSLLFQVHTVSLFPLMMWLPLFVVFQLNLFYQIVHVSATEYDTAGDEALVAALVILSVVVTGMIVGQSIVLIFFFRSCCLCCVFGFENMM